MDAGVQAIQAGMHALTGVATDVPQDQQRLLAENPERTLTLLYDMGIAPVPPEHFALAWTRFIEGVRAHICAHPHDTAFCARVLQAVIDEATSVFPVGYMRWTLEGWAMMVVGLCLCVLPFRDNMAIIQRWFVYVNNHLHPCIFGEAGAKDLMPYFADMLQALEARFDFGQTTTSEGFNRLENCLQETISRCGVREHNGGLTMGHFLFDSLLIASAAREFMTEVPWRRPQLRVELIKFTLAKHRSEAMDLVIDYDDFILAVGPNWLQALVSACISMALDSVVLKAEDVRQQMACLYFYCSFEGVPHRTIVAALSRFLTTQNVQHGDWPLILLPPYWQEESTRRLHPAPGPLFEFLHDVYDLATHIRRKQQQAFRTAFAVDIPDHVLARMRHRHGEDVHARASVKKSKIKRRHTSLSWQGYNEKSHALRQALARQRRVGHLSRANYDARIAAGAAAGASGAAGAASDDMIET